MLICIKFKFGISFNSLHALKDCFLNKDIDQIGLIFRATQQKDEGF